MQRFYSKRDNWAFYNAAGPSSTVSIPRKAEVDTEKKIKVTNAGKWALYGAVAGAIFSMLAKKSMFKSALIGGGAGLILGYLLGKNKQAPAKSTPLSKAAQSTKPGAGTAIKGDEINSILVSGEKLTQVSADKLRIEYDRIKEQLMTTNFITQPVALENRLKAIAIRLQNAGYSVVSFDAAGTHNMGVTKHWRNTLS